MFVSRIEDSVFWSKYLE